MDNGGFLCNGRSPNAFGRWLRRKKGVMPWKRQQHG